MMIWGFCSDGSVDHNPLTVQERVILKVIWSTSSWSDRLARAAPGGYLGAVDASLLRSIKGLTLGQKALLYSELPGGYVDRRALPPQCSRHPQGSWLGRPRLWVALKFFLATPGWGSYVANQVLPIQKSGTGPSGPRKVGTTSELWLSITTLETALPLSAVFSHDVLKAAICIGGSGNRRTKEPKNPADNPYCRSA